MIPADLSHLLDELERKSHLAKFGNKLHGFGTQAERVKKRDAARAAVERRITELLEQQLTTARYPNW